MLILTMRQGREDDESIVVGDEDVTFHLLGIRGSQVKIGIVTKSPSTPIHRIGVYRRIQQEKKDGKI